MRFKRDLIRMLMFITCVNMSTATTNSNLKMTARFADHRTIIMNFNCTQTPARRGGRIYMIIRCHLEATSGQNLMEGRQMRKKGLNLNVSRKFLKEKSSENVKNSQLFNITSSGYYIRMCIQNKSLHLFQL